MCYSYTNVQNSGSKIRVENYRPTSLTCLCCKIMDSIVYKSIYNHLHVNKLLNVNQHGFLTKASTLTTQLSCNNEWLNEIDYNRWVDVVFLDYSKAFDSVIVILNYYTNYVSMGLVIRCVNSCQPS